MSSVEDSDSFVAEQLFDDRFVEGFVFGVHEVLRVTEKYLAEDFPHHIGAVGVEEIHAPSVFRRGEATEHQQPSIGREERMKRVLFDGRLQFQKRMNGWNVGFGEFGLGRGVVKWVRRRFHDEGVFG